MGKPSPYHASVVVPLPDGDQIARSFGEGYDPDSALNVLKMMSGTGDFYPALIGMVKAVFGERDIDAKHREVIILRAASLLNCPYEWQANEQMAHNAGLSTPEIDAIAGDAPLGNLDDDYRRLIAVTDDYPHVRDSHRRHPSIPARQVWDDNDTQVHCHHRVVQPVEFVSQWHQGAHGNN
jgi:hypothetical protein